MLKATKGRKLSEEDKNSLLKLLTYEKVRGKPIYYNNYQKVLKGELLPEAVRARTLLQAYLLTQVMFSLSKALDMERYYILPGEIRFHFRRGSWRSIDLAVFEKEKIEPFIFQEKPLSVAPKVAVQIETKADLSRYGNIEEYAHEKTKDLLDGGVERVVWIFTKTKRVLLAEEGKDWKVQSWEKAFEVLEGIKVNLKDLIEEVS